MKKINKIADWVLENLLVVTNVMAMLAVLALSIFAFYVMFKFMFT